jgi:hypothetical protein
MVMKRTLFAIALLVAATFVTAGASAQDHRVKATVPFDFTVNGSAAPAGTYVISAPMGQNVLNISSWETKAHFLTAGVANWDDREKDNVLVFHKVGDQYYLSAIRCHDSSMNVYFPPSKAEEKAKTQTLQAGIPVSTDVMIALE